MTTRLFTVFIALLLTAVAVLTFAGSRPGNIDDAFVTLVYARHLADHGVLAWNLGSAPVDGFTSWLDVIVKAIALRCGVRDGLQLAWWLAVGCHVGVALMAGRLVWQVGLGYPQRLLVAVATGLAVAANVALADGSVFLLETPLFVLLALFALARVLRAPLATPGAAVATGMLLALLPLTRPEGLPLALGLCAALAWQAQRSQRRALVAALAVFLGMWLAYALWHHAVFGWWAPNTYYAKTSAERWSEVMDGVRYVQQSADAHDSMAALPLLLIALAPLLALWLWLRDRAHWQPLVPAWAALGVTGVVVWAGGDCYPGGRFVGLPEVLALAATGMLVVRQQGRVAHGALVVLTLTQLLALGDNPGARLAKVGHWPHKDAEFACEQEAIAPIARLLRRQPRGDATLAQSDWQRFKYFADDVQNLDLHGLNDAAVAHLPVAGPVLAGKFHHALVAQALPAVWVYGFGFRTAQPLAGKDMAAILPEVPARSPLVAFETPPALAVPSAAVRTTLLTHYAPASVAACGMFYNVLVRSDLVSSARASGLQMRGDAAP